MSRKKIVALIMGALLAVGIIGGSLAYFKSQDMVPNKFATTGDEKNTDTDIRIAENFDKEKMADKLVPGTKITKHVQIKNTDKYPQLIRVKFEVKILEDYASGKEMDDSKELTLFKYDNEPDPDNPDKTIDTQPLTKKQWKVTAGELAKELKKNLTATFVEDNIIHDLTKANKNKWYNADITNTLDSVYYYLGYVTEGRFTEDILESITLNKDAGIEFKGVNFEVKVIADGVQASNQGFGEVFKIQKTDALYHVLENGEIKYNEDSGEVLEADTRDGSVDIKSDIPQPIKRDTVKRD